jgi:preprotein translocase subunit SecA
MQLGVHIEEAIESQGKSIISNIEKNIVLGMIDNEWKEHLREMDELRKASYNAAIEQKDPLLVYKLESFNLFKAMMSRLNQEISSFLIKAQLPVEQQQAQIRTTAQAIKQDNYASARTNAPAKEEFSGREGYREAMESSYNQAQQPKRQPIIAEPKIGRNDPCPCGSGKKFKQCHGK